MTAAATASARRRIVSVCRGVPDWSDTNASAYRLHAELRAGGFESALIVLESAAEACFFRYLFGAHCADPDSLGDVHRCAIEEQPEILPPAALMTLVDALAPDLLIAWEAGAARVLKRAAPQVPLIWIAWEGASLERLIETGATRDFLSFRNGVERGIVYPRCDGGAERDAFIVCDLAVLPSALGHFTAQHFHRAYAGKLYGPNPLAAFAFRDAERFASLRRPFAERDVDVVFLADRWHGAARNLRVIKSICAALATANVHVVGECGAGLPAYTHGVLSRRRRHELLGRCKVAVFPGLAEIAPSGMFAAAAMGCNVVASPNCGFWQLCHDQLLVASPSRSEFVDCIERAQMRPFADQRDAFLGAEADELLETLALF
jgi:hypothetical protein